VVKDKVFVWGGCRNKAVSRYLIQACNDCYCYTQGAWKQISQKGRVPQARESQAAGVLNNRYIMIYGGAKDYPLNDFHIFDTEDSTWYGLTRLEGDPFPLRDGSTMSVVKGSVVYLFGGKNDKDQYTNSMYRVILDNYQFEKRAPPPILKVEEVKCKGKLPRARSDHCAVVF
jgi:N-acetylneuraminic acid mutarotase